MAAKIFAHAAMMHALSRVRTPFRTELAQGTHYAADPWLRTQRLA